MPAADTSIRAAFLYEMTVDAFIVIRALSELHRGADLDNALRAYSACPLEGPAADLAAHPRLADRHTLNPDKIAA